MIETIKDVINILGASNALTILIFIMSVFIAYYFFFKNFFRLTYSTGRIFKNIGELTNNETEFVTRILFYNNGRKTITNNEIQKLELISSEKINSLKEIKGNENISIVTNTDKATIEINFIDSTDFFILEVNHTGELFVKGRISETGNLLHTEPKFWTNFNFVFLIFFIVISFYNLTFLGDENDILKVGTNLFLLFGIYGVFRFIHSIFFIPDSLTSKYLDTKDKFAKEFKY
jgi:hypothetical protein